MQQGLAVTWVEGEQELQKRGLKSIPPSVLNTCKQSKKSQKVEFLLINLIKIYFE